MLDEPRPREVAGNALRSPVAHCLSCVLRQAGRLLNGSYCSRYITVRNVPARVPLLQDIGGTSVHNVHGVGIPTPRPVKHGGIALNPEPGTPRKIAGSSVACEPHVGRNLDNQRLMPQ